MAVSRTAIELGLFEKLAEGDGRTKTVEQLARSTGADAKLLGALSMVSLSGLVFLTHFNISEMC